MPGDDHGGASQHAVQRRRGDARGGLGHLRRDPLHARRRPRRGLGRDDRGSPARGAVRVFKRNHSQRARVRGVDREAARPALPPRVHGFPPDAAGALHLPQRRRRRVPVLRPREHVPAGELLESHQRGRARERRVRQRQGREPGFRGRRRRRRRREKKRLEDGRRLGYSEDHQDGDLEELRPVHRVRVFQERVRAAGGGLRSDRPERRRREAHGGDHLRERAGRFIRRRQAIAASREPFTDAAARYRDAPRRFITETERDCGDSVSGRLVESARRHGDHVHRAEHAREDRRVHVSAQIRRERLPLDQLGRVRPDERPRGSQRTGRPRAGDPDDRRTDGPQSRAGHAPRAVGPAGLRVPTHLRHDHQPHQNGRPRCERADSKVLRAVPKRATSAGARRRSRTVGARTGRGVSSERRSQTHHGLRRDDGHAQDAARGVTNGLKRSEDRRAVPLAGSVSARPDDGSRAKDGGGVTRGRGRRFRRARFGEHRERVVCRGRARPQAGHERVRGGGALRRRGGRDGREKRKGRFEI